MYVSSSESARHRKRPSSLFLTPEVKFTTEVGMRNIFILIYFRILLFINIPTANSFCHLLGLKAQFGAAWMCTAENTLTLHFKDRSMAFHDICTFIEMPQRSFSCVGIMKNVWSFIVSYRCFTSLRADGLLSLEHLVFGGRSNRLYLFCRVELIVQECRQGQIFFCTCHA